jgi:pyruvate dehydrogenase E2 component (dihydrolipoamide acetyltransferase)
MSSKREIIVPDIGDFDKVPVIEVLVAVGDSIEAEQSLVTLESDKATMEVPSSSAGKLVELRVKEGDEVSEGDVIAVVEVEGEKTEKGQGEKGKGEKEKEKEKEKGEEETEKGKGEREKGETEDGRRKTEDRKSEDKGSDMPAPPVPFEEMGKDAGSLPHASPSVRRLARQLGADLTKVSGSGRKGRITEEDLKNHIRQRMETPAASGGAGLDVAAAPKVDFSKFGEIEERKLSRIQRISGPALHRNWVSIPHVTQFDEADITSMEAFRKASQPDAEKAGTKLTPLVFLIKAVVASLQAFPDFNASLSSDGETLIRKKYFHVGVAVDTPNGLVVPVLRDCDKKGLIELSQELTELSGRAREGKLKGDEMKGGCFTISSLGGIGGTAFTPIINAPELAILGVSRAAMKPVWDGEQFRPRLMLPLSLSYDHRVIDGANAARFTRYLADQLEELRRLLL